MDLYREMEAMFATSSRGHHLLYSDINSVFLSFLELVFVFCTGPVRVSK